MDVDLLRSIEQIQNGLGIADGKLKRLRAEIARLVSRGALRVDEKWFLLT